MIPRLRLRAVGTRTTRADPRERRLESLAGEFALLTQRRARTLHQIELLDQQRIAAAMNLHKVQTRLAWLVQSMEALDGFAMPAAPEPEPVAKAEPARPAPGRAGSSLASRGQARLRVAGSMPYPNPGLGSARSEPSRRHP